MTVSTGDQIQATTGLWNFTPTSFTYQWQYSTDGVASAGSVVGATRSDYITSLSDLGLYFRCGVTATSAAGSSSVSYTDWVGPVGVYVPPVEVDDDGHAIFPDLTETQDSLSAWIEMKRGGRRFRGMFGSSPSLWG